MAVVKKIRVEVAYATPQRQKILCIEIPENSTLKQAIECSGILALFPEIDVNTQKVGIFGKQRKLSGRVQAGDRVEIYRPLLMDPKEARRQRVSGDR